MNSSSNLLVLGATGQVGKLVAKTLKRRGASFSVGSRRRANLVELADQFGASRFIDLDDPRTFDEALETITGIFLITGYTVDMLVQSKSNGAVKSQLSGRRVATFTPSEHSSSRAF
jgi:NAD(P)H dehydrogenase (quinone)